jgi:FMN phosphatase YigB (HAD superfamily)
VHRGGRHTLVAQLAREDVDGALAAGLRAVLVARGERPPAAEVPVVRSLAELPQYA